MRDTPVTVGMMRRFVAEIRGRARAHASRVDIHGMRSALDVRRHDALMELAEIADMVFGRACDDLDQ